MALCRQAAEASDRELVARTVAGDGTAFDDLVRRHQGSVYRLARALLGDPEEAEDVTVETFTRAYRALGGFDLERPLAPWLSVIAANLSRTRMRRRGPATVPLDAAEDAGGASEPGHAGDPVGQALSHETRRVLLSALRELPDGCRDVAVLRFLHDLPRAEIARLLGLRESTVMGRLARARRALAARLGPYFAEEGF